MTKLIKTNTGYRNKHFIEIPLIVNTYDIDAAGHVNNIVFVRWLEDLRNKLVSDICDFQKLYNDGYYIVVASTFIKYKKQLKIFDKPYGFMEMVSNKRGLIILESTIKSNSAIYAIAEQKCVLLNLKENKIVKENVVNRLFNLE